MHWEMWRVSLHYHQQWYRSLVFKKQKVFSYTQAKTKAWPRRMHPTGSKKNSEYAGDFFLALKAWAFSAWRISYHFMSNLTMTKWTIWVINKERMHPPIPPTPPTPGPYRRKHLVLRSMRGRCLKHAGRWQPILLKKPADYMEHLLSIPYKSLRTWLKCLINVVWTQLKIVHRVVVLP